MTIISSPKMYSTDILYYNINYNYISKEFNVFCTPVDGSIARESFEGFENGVTVQRVRHTSTVGITGRHFTPLCLLLVPLGPFHLSVTDQDTHVFIARTGSATKGKKELCCCVHCLS